MTEEQNTKQCPFCGGEIFENAQKCRHCAKWLNEQKQVCPYCLKEIPLNAKKCSYCGSVVSRKKSELVKFMTILLDIVIVLLGVGIEVSSDGSGWGFIFAIVLALGAWLYFLPTVIADGKMHKQTNLIFLVNLLFGYTIIGWIGALVWALTDSDCQFSFSTFSSIIVRRSKGIPTLTGTRFFGNFAIKLSFLFFATQSTTK